MASNREVIARFRRDMVPPLDGPGKRFAGGWAVFDADEFHASSNGLMDLTDLWFPNERIEFKLDSDLAGGAGSVDDQASWGADFIQAREIHESGITGKGVKIGILDSGLDSSHPVFSHLLGEKRIKAFAEFDKSGKKVVQFDTAGIPLEDSSATPTFGHYHGTFVTSIISGSSDGTKSFGIAPGASIYVAKVLGAWNEGWPAQILSGLYWLADQGCDVINASLGWEGYRPHWIDGISRILEDKCVILAASGNEFGLPGEPPHRSPANYLVSGNEGRLLSVGSYYVNSGRPLVWENSGRGRTEWGSLSSSPGGNPFGNLSEKDVPDLAAPGVQIVAADLAGRYREESGTSFAVPHVVGAVSLILESIRQSEPTASAVDALDILFKSCLSIDGIDAAVGNGLGRGWLHGDSLRSTVEGLIVGS